jgi:hypothetical protein
MVVRDECRGRRRCRLPVGGRNRASDEAAFCQLKRSCEAWNGLKVFGTSARPPSDGVQRRPWRERPVGTNYACHEFHLNPCPKFGNQDQVRDPSFVADSFPTFSSIAFSVGGYRSRHGFLKPRGPCKTMANFLGI